MDEGEDLGRWMSEAEWRGSQEKALAVASGTELGLACSQGHAKCPECGRLGKLGPRSL